MTDPKWKKFERLVAAIHQADAKGASVKWNDSINGRQFDVVLRFTIGFYNYLTVVECKDQARSVSVDQVESFVVKSKDAGADKAVIVSSSNFQEGAFSVANRHNIELFSLSFIDKLPSHLLSEELHPCLRIYNIRLRQPSGEWLVLPDNRNLPTYLAHHLTISCGTEKLKLCEFIDKAFSHVQLAARSTPQEYMVPLRPKSIAYLPHLRLDAEVCEMAFLYKLASFHVLRQPGVDPALMSGLYEYRDLRTGAVKIFPKYYIKVKYDTIFRPGAFYFSPNMEFSYYCHSISDGIAIMIMVESYQHGMLMQVAFKQSVKFQNLYVEITDPEEIARLRRVGANILRANGVA